ncbi:MAG TPA: hypothetical protein VJU84_16590 [Pyrinomonadaceae bacterium]|nr:hypothetical protein [Pyrinomonadaceae bacterium]
MARPAYIVLNADGTVSRTHTTDISGTGAPTTGTSDLENLIGQGYVARREHPLEGGRILIVMDRP